MVSRTAPGSQRTSTSARTFVARCRSLYHPPIGSVVGLTPLVVVATALLLLATSASASRRISPAAYAQRADPICADYRARVRALPRVALTDFPRIVKLAIAVRAIVVLENKKIHAIPKPASERKLATKWVASRDRALVLVDKLRVAAQKRNTTLVEQANAELNANGSRGRALARLLGMKVCSKK